MFVTLFAFAAQFAIAASLAPRALAQNPTTLPTDPNLAAYVAVTNNFQSLATSENRVMTLKSWVAAFGPGETFDFSALTDRAFQTLDLPTDVGWSLFSNTDANLSMTVQVTDTANRLGNVQVYEVDSGRLVATLQADIGGGQVMGTVLNDPAVTDYRMVISDAASNTLSTMAVGVGKVDAIAWYSFPCGFQPYCPAPIAAMSDIPSSNYTPQLGTDYFQVVDDPKTAPGVQTQMGIGASRGCACLAVVNGDDSPKTVAPPQAYSSYFLRDVIADTVSPRVPGLKFGDPTGLTALNNLMATLTARIPTPALSSVSFPPYSTGYGYWQIDFQGQATGIIAVPFERVRKGGSWNIVLNAILPHFQAQRSFASLIITSMANDWLGQLANRQSSGFVQGDVMSIGDVYVLTASQRTAEPRGLAPILDSVTFTLQPDIAPPNGATYSGTVTNDGAATTPSPPTPANGGNVSFTTPNTVTLQLAKGYKWHIAGNVLSPSGAYDTTTVNFQTPQANVPIPATLKVLLTLHVYTTSTANPNGPLGVTVQVLNAAGTVVATGPSTLQADGRYMFTAVNVPPGQYTIKGNKSTSGGTWSGTSSLGVDRGVLQETTLTVNYTPQHP